MLDKTQRRLLRSGTALIANHVMFWSRQAGKQTVVNFWRTAGKIALQ